jgi:maltose O-acetyltransferase
MSEQKERMLSGRLYLASDPVLSEEHRRCRVLIERFNATGVIDEEARRSLLAGLLGGFGEGATIKPPFQCDYGYNISLGARSFVNYGAVFLDCAPIRIGEDVLLATCVQLLTATHPLEVAPRRRGLEYALPITIRDGAWLGGGVIVCPGVTVGENSVVGAGSVVTRDVAPNVVAAGNPCRVLRPLPE